MTANRPERSKFPVRGAFDAAAATQPPDGVVGALLAGAGGHAEPEQPAPAVKAAPAKAARRGKPRQAARSALVPEMPTDRYQRRQQLNIRIPEELHWALNAAAFMTRTTMTDMIIKWLTAYAVDPDLWVEFFATAEDGGYVLADVLNPAVRAVLESMQQDG